MMPDYGKAPKGETAAAKKARQAKFYTKQRVDAVKSHDVGTERKIYAKLGQRTPANAQGFGGMSRAKYDPEMAKNVRDLAGTAALGLATDGVGSLAARGLGGVAEKAGTALATRAGGTAAKTAEKYVRAKPVAARAALGPAKAPTSAVARREMQPLSASRSPKALGPGKPPVKPPRKPPSSGGPKAPKLKQESVFKGMFRDPAEKQTSFLPKTEGAASRSAPKSPRKPAAKKPASRAK